MLSPTCMSNPEIVRESPHWKKVQSARNKVNRRSSRDAEPLAAVLTDHVLLPEEAWCLCFGDHRLLHTRRGSASFRRSTRVFVWAPASAHGAMKPSERKVLQGMRSRWRLNVSPLRHPSPHECRYNKGIQRPSSRQQITHDRTAGNCRNGFYASSEPTKYGELCRTGRCPWLKSTVY